MAIARRDVDARGDLRRLLRRRDRARQAAVVAVRRVDRHVVDELSSVGYMVAIGWHCHLAFGPRIHLGDLGFDPWHAAIAVGVATSAGRSTASTTTSSSRSARRTARTTSGDSRSCRRPARAPCGSRPRRRRRSRRRASCRRGSRSRPTRPYIVRRDFIVVGRGRCSPRCTGPTSRSARSSPAGSCTSSSSPIDHVQLRSLRRSLVRRGSVLQSP